jgi:nucleoside-diphosphate-sugar epimerase
MTTLVTGAFGCIGAWVVRALLAAGERPVLYDLGDDPWRVRMIAGPDAPSRAVDRARRHHRSRESRARRARARDPPRDPPGRVAGAALPARSPRGAAINVVGTANVFDVVRAAAGQIDRVVYVSSAAVFGAPSLYPPGPLADDAPAHPATHYGVYKVANEETARVYWEEHRSVVGLSVRSRSTDRAAISASPPTRRSR